MPLAHEAPPSITPLWRRCFAPCTIILLIIGSYWNSLEVPFFFDDPIGIVKNSTIRDLRALNEVLSPPANGSGVTGRPIINLSLALNYAAGGLDVTGYHATNMLFHALAALALFGVVHRTLRLPSMVTRFGAQAQTLAFIVAAIWATHPLQTESVTCVIQRTELLLGLFYLTTFYCFIRAVTTPVRKGWNVAAVVACLLGMGSKEVMVTAPFLLFLYDRTFVSGTWRMAWTRHRMLHLAFAATLVVLFGLVIGMGGTRGTAAGFGIGIPWWAYALKQADAVLLYLRLAGWPHPLVVFYGVDVIYNPADVALQLAIILGLFGLAVAAVCRGSAAGFAGAWFFCILAPSSSVVPLVTQTVSEHRMYLPLVAPLVLGVAAVFRSVGLRAIIALWLLPPALALTTRQRNTDYRNELSIWSDTVAKRPSNPEAQVALGAALRNLDRLPEAIQHFQRAFQQKPDLPDASINIAAVLVETNQPDAALPIAQRATKLAPQSAAAYTVLGQALGAVGRIPEAITNLEAAIRLDPSYAEAHHALGNIRLQSGDTAAAIKHFETALELKPDFAATHTNLATALQASAPAEAIAHFESALRLKPNQPETHNNFANALLALGRAEQAREHYQTAVRLRPDYNDARYNLGQLWLKLNRAAEALAEFDEVLRRLPDFRPAAELQQGRATALGLLGRPAESLEALRIATRLQPTDSILRFNLGNTLLQNERVADAIAEYEQALRLNPNFAEAYLNAGNALLRLNRLDDAIRCYEAALQIRPGYPDAADNLRKATEFRAANRPRN